MHPSIPIHFIQDVHLRGSNRDEKIKSDYSLKTYKKKQNKIGNTQKHTAKIKLKWIIARLCMLQSLTHLVFEVGEQVVLPLICGHATVGKHLDIGLHKAHEHLCTGYTTYYKHSYTPYVCKCV